MKFLSGYGLVAVALIVNSPSLAFFGAMLIMAAQAYGWD